MLNKLWGTWRKITAWVYWFYAIVIKLRIGTMGSWVTGDNQPKVLLLEIWLRLEIPCSEIIFLHPLELPSHSPLSCSRTVKDSQEKKRGTFFLQPPSPNIYTPTPSSNLATFHSDWTQDRPKIRTMWVIPSWPQQVVKRRKSQWPQPCSLPVTNNC